MSTKLKSYFQNDHDFLQNGSGSDSNGDMVRNDWV